jgi:hypothetical protein
MTLDRSFFHRMFRATLLVGTALAILFSPVLCLAAGAQVGKVIAMEGKVEVKRETEAGFHRAQLSEEVYERDLIRTGPRSKVKILYQDESLLFLAEDSAAQIKEFHYDPLQKYRRALLKGLGGKIRFLIAKLMPNGTSRFEVETDTAVVGVRGTDGIAVMKSPTQVICLSGEIYVHGLGLTQEVILTPYMMTIVEAGRNPAIPFPADKGYIRELLEGFRIRLLSERDQGELIPPIPPSAETFRSGAGGPANMTETIRSWSPSWNIGPGEEKPAFPPVLLEPPAGQRRLSPPPPSPKKEPIPSPQPFPEN